MTVERWQIWYDDGSTVSSEVATWEETPQEGVVHVLLLFDDGTSRHCSGSDLYWSRDFGEGEIYANDNDRDALLRRFPWVKFGRWSPDGRVAAAVSEARETAQAWHQERYKRTDDGG